MSFDHFYI